MTMSCRRIARTAIERDATGMGGKYTTAIAERAALPRRGPIKRGSLCASHITVARWAQTIHDKTSDCTDVFVYFKHEEAGKGPEFVRLLLQTLAAL
ncbi:MAG TPA: hypothetical protein VGL34_25315 [Steroidobacteraceae bacterium]